MKVEIRYDSTYTYERRVSFSPHIFRLMPKVDQHLKVRRFDFLTNRGGVVNWRRDLFDNETASCFYPNFSKTMMVRLRLVLEISVKNAFGFLLEPTALQIASVVWPMRLDSRSAASVSAVSPDCVIASITVLRSIGGLR